MIEIQEIKKPTQEVYQACLKFVPQLLPTLIPPTFELFSEIIDTPTTHFFIAKENGNIVGMLTLIFYRIPAGLCARLEDLFVDEEHRRKGIGTQLCQAAIDSAKNGSAVKLDLTSNPSRIEAHRLYESLGFNIYDTSVYRITFH